MDSPHPAPPPTRLDSRTLAIATIASVLCGLLASAVGTGPVGSLVCAALAPALTMFIVHSGPHLRRRIVAVTVLIAFLRSCRAALAAVVPSRRRPPAATARRRGPRPALARPGWPVAGLTACAAFTITLVLLTLPELVLGGALLSDRRLTLWPVDPASAKPSVPRRQGPTLEVPADGVRRVTASRQGARVTFDVRAADSRRAPLTADCLPASGQIFPVGTTAVTCTATQADGATVHRSFPVIVERQSGPRPEEPRDRIGPHLSLPGDIVRAAPSAGGVRVTYAVSASDAVDGFVTPVCRPASGALFPVGRTVVSCETNDAAGNRSAGSFTVIVSRPSETTDRDTTAPQLTVPSGLRESTADADGTVVRYSATAADGGSGVPVTCAPASGSRFPLGRTTVRCAATDRAGNTAAKQFTVEVVRLADHEPPRLTVPKPVRVTATDRLGAVVRYRARAIDARDGTLVPACRPPSGVRFPIGTTVVGCTASDHAGNRAERQFDVTVLPFVAADREKPEFTGPRTIVVPTDEPAGTLVDYPFPSAKDDRDQSVDVGCTPARVVAGRRTSVDCTATDDAKNVARGAFEVDVRVTDKTPPRFVGPSLITLTSSEKLGTPVAYPHPPAEDDEDASVDVACTPDTAPVGDIVSVSCTATDDAGHTASRGFRVRVVPT